MWGLAKLKRGTPRTKPDREFAKVVGSLKSARLRTSGVWMCDLSRGSIGAVAAVVAELQCGSGGSGSSQCSGSAGSRWW